MKKSYLNVQFFHILSPELKTNLEWWISGLMLNPLFFLISRLNNACSPLIFNLQINYPIRIKDIPFKSFQLRSQKFKLPRLQLSPMYAYADYFTLFRCPFLFFSINPNLTRIFSFKIVSFLSTTYTIYILQYINNLLYAKPYDFVLLLILSLYRLEPINI